VATGEATPALGVVSAGVDQVDASEKGGAMGISARWLKSLVGLRKVERQQQHKEDEDVGRMVWHLPISLQFWRILVLKLVVGELMLFIA